LVETLVEILEAEGFEVQTAPNGKVGLELLAVSRPDVVILDYMMPVMDGLQLLTIMRKDPAHAERPVILMTAAVVERLPEPRLWTQFLRKPLSSSRVLAAIRSLLP
jgi:CheY-like chemotaxis protein